MYNVKYDAPSGSRHYLVEDVPTLELAKIHLRKFRTRYMDEQGNGKAYPNGKGFYPFTNVRIVKRHG
jgi:hypothetical protein